MLWVKKNQLVWHDIYKCRNSKLIYSYKLDTLYVYVDQ